LIGAEDGATLGALWATSEAHRFRLLPTGNKNDTPESKDIIACIWLSIAPNVGPAGRGMSVAGGRPRPLRAPAHPRAAPVPMVFMYGKDDMIADSRALQLVKTIKPNYQPNVAPVDTDPLKATGIRKIAGAKLQGAKLLTKELDTRKWITETYLPKLVIDEK